MKRLILTLGILFVFSISAHAQMCSDMTGEMKQRAMMEERQMPMMLMCQQMMTGHGMAMYDMMHMMTEMMKMQKQIMKDMKLDKKKEMMTEMDKMMERMDKMISDMRGIMTKGMMCPPAIEPTEKEKENQKDDKPKTDPHKHQ